MREESSAREPLEGVGSTLKPHGEAILQATLDTKNVQPPGARTCIWVFGLWE